jgi:hypothetical protein
LAPEATGRAIYEYLAVLDDAAFGAATEIVPISPADPRWTGAYGGQAFLAYFTNYLIDVEKAIIVDVEPTTEIRQMSGKPTTRGSTMCSRNTRILQRVPSLHLVADGSSRLWLQSRVSRTASTVVFPFSSASGFIVPGNLIHLRSAGAILSSGSYHISCFEDVFGNRA